MRPAAYRAGSALIEMQSNLQSIRLGLRQVMRTAQILRISAEERSSVEIVLAEVLNNVVEHAYAGSEGVIRLWIRLDDAVLSCRIEDEGRMMPGGQLPKAPTPTPDQLSEGGFGLHLIRSLVVDLDYQRLGPVNCLSFRLAPEHRH